MSNEEKILAILEKHGEMLEKHGEMLEKHGEILEKHGEILEKQGAALAQIQQDLARVALTQENVVLPKIQLLYEGHSAILDRLDQLAEKSRVEVLEDDVAVLKSAVRQLHHEIAELRKAQ